MHINSPIAKHSHVVQCTIQNVDKYDSSYEIVSLLPFITSEAFTLLCCSSMTLGQYHSHIPVPLLVSKYKNRAEWELFIDTREQVGQNAWVRRHVGGKFMLSGMSSNIDTNPSCSSSKYVVAFKLFKIISPKI